MNFKAVLFDLDGTLVDSVIDVANAMNQVLLNNNFPIHPATDYIDMIGDGMENLVTKSLPEENRTKTFIRKCFSEMKATYSTMWMNNTQLYPGIAELLTSLNERNIKLAILSNKPHNFAQLIADKLLAGWNFDVVMGLSDGSLRKPDPTSALAIASQINLDSAYFIYIGDSVTDIKTAINAGMYPVGVSWGYRSTSSLIESGAKLIIHKPKDILSLFEN